MVISPWLVLVVAAMGGLVIFLQRKILPRIAAGSRQLALIDVAISQRVTEDFQALRLLHSSGQLDAADANLRSQMGELERASRDQSTPAQLAMAGPVRGARGGGPLPLQLRQHHAVSGTARDPRPGTQAW